MSAILYANNATTTIAGSINNIATTIALAPGSGALFPAVGVGQFFMGTLTDAATGLVNEIVKVTARATDTLTVVRGQEGTSAQAWSAGDNFSNLVTAGSLGNYASFSTYAGNPNGSVTSGKIGEELWDTANQLLWVAASAGVNNAWVPSNQSPTVTGPSVAVPNSATYTTIFGNTISGLMLVKGTIGSGILFTDIVVFQQFGTFGVLKTEPGTGSGGTRLYRSKPSTGELQLSITGATDAPNVVVASIAPNVLIFS